MASHNLDNQPENRLATELADIKSQLSQMRTLQLQGTASVNLQSQDYTQYSFSVGGNSTSWLQVRFTNSQGKKVFGTIEYTFYQGSVSPSNDATDPSAGSTYTGNWDIRMTPHYASNVTYGDSLYGPLTALSYSFLITNKTAGALTLIFTGRQRIIISGGTT